MHSYFVVRGIKDKLQRWVEDMEKVFIPFNMNNQPSLVQLSMRKVEIYEVVYPEVCHDAVMKIIQPNTTADYTQNSANTKSPKRVDKYLNWLRKLLALDKMEFPKDMVSNNTKSIYRQFLGIHPIGSKKDVKEEFTNERI